jgi:hypothetical protein
MKPLQLHARKLSFLLAAVLFGSPAWALPQSKDQRACINALNKSAKKVGAAQGRTTCPA